MLTRKQNYALSDTAIRHIRDHIEIWLAEPGHDMTMLSEQTGMNKKVVWDFLNKQSSRYPKIRFLVGISHVLGCTVSELIGEAVNPFFPTYEMKVLARNAVVRPIHDGERNGEEA